MSKARTALEFAGIALLGLVSLLALVFALVQTPTGKAWLAAALGRVIADPGERITITGLTGFVPFDMDVARIEAVDPLGTYLVVDQATLAISPGELLAGRIAVRRLSARAIDFERPPATPSHLSLAMLLHLPLPVRLDTLRIDRLTLGAALVGEPVTASLSASADFASGHAAADLALERVDGTSGEAHFHLALAGSPPMLDLAGDIAEPSGRLLADALGKTAPLPLALHLAGKGPLADWHGSLAARAGADATLDAQFSIRAGDGMRIAADGNAEVASLAPAQLQRLLAAPVQFAGALTFDRSRLALSRLTLTTGALRLTAKGAVERATGALSGEAAAALPDLAAFAPLAGAATQGTATLSLALGGSLRAPKARVTLSGEKLTFAGNRIGAAAATIDLGAAGDPFAAATPLAVTASGELHDVTPAAMALPKGLRERIDWRLGGKIERDAARFSLDELAVEDAGAHLVVHAAGADGKMAGEAALSVPDLSDLGDLTGAPRSGALTLASDFHAAADGSATAVLSGTLERLRSGVEAIDRLTGDKVALAATLARTADGTVAAREVSIDGADVGLTGSAQRAPDGRVDASWRLVLPRLAALDPALGGRAVVDGTLGGTTAAPTASATVTADAVAAGTLRLDHVEAHASLADLAKAAGVIDLRFRRGALQGTVSADTGLSRNTLRFDRIRLAAAGTTLGGALALQLSTGTLDGTLDGNVPTLAPWSALAGMPLGGNATLKARLAGGKGQSLALTLDGKTLAIAGAHVGTLHATAQLADLLTKPTGQAELVLEQASYDKATAARLTLAGKSDRPGRFALSLGAEGRAGEAYTLSAAAEAGFNRGAVELRLTRLAGKLGHLPVQLHAPLLVTRRGDDLAFAGLDLGFGGGRIAGDGSLKGAALALHLKAAGLPVHDLGELAGQNDISGVLGFEATVAGSRTRPEGRLIVDGEELRFAAEGRSDLAPLSLVLSAEWQKGVITAKGRLAGPQNAALGFSGQAPLALDPQRLTPLLPPQGALALHLEGDGDLANLADVVPLGEDRLAGRFDVDVSVGGTVAAPVASGSLSVRNGRYESLFWGTTLSDVSFDLVGDHERLVLQNFHADDGAKGSLTLSGGVDLAAAAGPTFDVTGRFASFRAVQRDEATATVSGDVSLTGTLTAPRLGAKLTIEQAELRVPKRLPETVQAIPVTVIDSATGKVLSTPDTSGPRVALLALALDVSVDMPGRVFVRGRGLDSEWRGRLTVTGTTAEPRLDGKLEVVRGTYDFLGKTASLTSGTITFLGNARIDPEINIEARASSADVIAIIRITGTALRPAIKLASQPDLPQDEILARVLFGTGIGQVNAAQGIEIAQAAAALANGGDPGVLDRLRQGLGLDRLAFGSSTSATSPLSNVAMPSTPAGVPSAFATTVGGAPTPLAATGATSSAGAGSVSAGKYVANGVYVGVSQGLTAGSSAVDVQIDVTRHISIDTTAGQTAGTGIGVNWKLDY